MARQKKFKVHSLIDKVYKPLNLYIAWEKVKANKGKGGVDGVSIAEFENQLHQNIRQIHRQLKEKRYQPRPVRRVNIPKDNQAKRPLGIPTVTDRVVQQALLNRMERIFEPKFKDSSFGYRKGRNQHQAIDRIRHYKKKGYSWVVDVDIKAFFDNVEHEKLLDLVNEEIADGRVLALIRSFLESGVMEDMQLRYEVTGTPQGGVLSPLLANIYLHPLDERMEGLDVGYVRYADDCIIMAHTKSEAEQALRVLQQFLQQKLNLELNMEKTKLRHYSQGFEFLGFKMATGYCDYRIPRDKAIKAFKDKIRKITRRQQPKTIEQIIKEVNPIIRGWGNYFVQANIKNLYWWLDGWILDRVRAFKEKRWGTYESQSKWSNVALRKLGLISLRVLMNRCQSREDPKLFPVMGQRWRKAVYGRTVRTV